MVGKILTFLLTFAGIALGAFLVWHYFISVYEVKIKTSLNF
jgi:hypothetical protein